MDQVVVIGNGLEGAAIAERLVAVGVTTFVATRKPAAELAVQLASTVPGAHATELGALPDGPILLAIPLSGTLQLDADEFAGRLVVDVTNYWPKLDDATEFANSPRDSSLIVQRHLSSARVVKTLNHMAHLDLSFDARPATADFRRAQAVAGDSFEDRLSAARLLDRMGYDAVDAGPLENGRMFGPGTQIFNGGWRTAAQLARILRRRTGYPAAKLEV